MPLSVGRGFPRWRSAGLPWRARSSPAFLTRAAAGRGRFSSIARGQWPTGDIARQEMPSVGEYTLGIIAEGRPPRLSVLFEANSTAAKTFAENSCGQRASGNAEAGKVPCPSKRRAWRATRKLLSQLGQRPPGRFCLLSSSPQSIFPPAGFPGGHSLSERPHRGEVAGANFKSRGSEKRAQQHPRF